MSLKTVSFNRNLPLDDSWDVIVAGGGPAGCTAAAAAAREGARTLLLEASGCLGGMGTAGLVPAWCPFTDGEKIIYRGLAQTVFDRSRNQVAHVSESRLDWVAIDPEGLKQIYDDLMGETGVTVLFHSVLSAVSATDGTVDTLFVANKSGLSAYRAKIYVDATGDADLTAYAGSPCHKGDPADGTLQPATHCFTLANIDSYQYRFGRQLFHLNPTSPIKAMVADQRYPLIVDSHTCNNQPGPDCVGFNAGHVYDLDATDPVALSNAMVTGRRAAQQYRDALAEYMPEIFGNAFLVNTGALMGVRETRRIVGEYDLTDDDYMARRDFPDEICRNAYFIDVHAKLDDRAAQEAEDPSCSKQSHFYKPGESHGIPYRCLIPKALQNVLVAGRPIASERRVNGSVRVMPVCLCTGEAAGLAAAMAVADELQDVREVETERLRQRLREHGAWLP